LKLLITGAGGFIGSYLAKHLVGYDIDAVTRKELDLCDPFAVKHWLANHRYDAIVHCASRGRNDARSTDPSILAENVLAWANLAANRNHYGMLINLATGAEFDLDTNIDNVAEEDIWKFYPSTSYGLSKNMIARSAQNLPNFYNLRIFGCFDPSEDNRRPLKRLSEKLNNEEPFVVTGDKLFDMISVEDLTTVIQAVLDGKIIDKDLNMVYNQKYKLSEILKLYAQIHNLDEGLISIESTDSNNYTGNGSKLNNYNLPLLGLELSLKHYTR